MTKDRILTAGKLPQRKCPHCGSQVLKAMKDGELIYVCGAQGRGGCGKRGPWHEAPKREFQIKRGNDQCMTR